jgi:hypothetical protein
VPVPGSGDHQDNPVRRRHARPDDGDDEAHLADRRIGEHGLGVALRQPEQHGGIGAGEARRDEA